MTRAEMIDEAVREIVLAPVRMLDFEEIAYLRQGAIRLAFRRIALREGYTMAEQPDWDFVG